MFKVGDKVACINGLVKNTYVNSLKINNIYTISEIRGILVRLHETNICYNSNRFMSLQAYRRVKLNQLMKCSK